ncbi:hypothetical protein [Pseudomonas sp. DWP3-1-2]|uniref:hypothetical protein n=1 Tax=Pseudomonas sp. DWP3-1-2 TaxID=2804645 RepID=UPI003CE97D99
MQIVSVLPACWPMSHDPVTQCVSLMTGRVTSSFRRSPITEKIPGNLLSCFAMQFSDGFARVLRPVCRCWPGDVVSRCLDVADRARSIIVPVNDQWVETVLVIVRGSG